MWAEIILIVCEKLDSANVRYHADASSSLYVNGFNFEMDDFDVTVEWGSIERVRSIFFQYYPTEVSGNNPSKFIFKINGKCIDVMSYKSKSGIGPASERHRVKFSGKYIWSKKPSFYLERVSAAHPHRADMLKFFSEN